MVCCHNAESCRSEEPSSARWRLALWIALAVNAGFFIVEFAVGAMSGSAALQADALDFFGDAANYAISLVVVGAAMTWRSRAALVKGGTMIAFAIWVLASTVWHAWTGTVPTAAIMGVTGIAAVCANGGVALMFLRFRTGDANMRSVWLCSRNDVIGNIAVLLAAAGVFGTGGAWPDLIVAATMGGLGLQAGLAILRHVREEMRTGTASLAPDRQADRKLVPRTLTNPGATAR